MMPRVAGASLGLLAFSIVLLGGIISRNPATVTLSRGILALFLFFVIGLVLGAAAQRVLAEYEKQRKDALLNRGTEGPDGLSSEQTQGSAGDPGAPMTA